MSKDYAADILRTTNGCLLELVPEFGGLTNRLQFQSAKGPVDVIVGLPSKSAMETDKVFRNIPIFPVVNRLRDGRYEFNGKTYQLPVNETSRNNALHGFIHHIKPEVSVVEGDEVSEATLRYDCDGSQQGYPFKAEVVIRYTLRASSELDIEYRVHNRDKSPMPIGVGWHPYFGLSEKMDTLSLKLPRSRKLAIDERMLPTGERLPYHEFDQLRPMGDIQFDDCFALEDSDVTTVAKTILWSESQKLGLEIWQKTGELGLNYLQVCIAQDRLSIAIESVSCGIDAFNTGDGLITLAPDDSFTAHMGVRLITSV
jgi:aldose 1-epimerase